MVYEKLIAAIKQATRTAILAVWPEIKAGEPFFSLTQERK